MKKISLLKMASALAAVGFSALFVTNASAAFIPLNGRTNYFQNFDSLISSGKGHFNLPGWAINKPGDFLGDGGNIFADDGNNMTSQIYSYGLAGSGNRALGVLDNYDHGGLPGMFGANFQNTGSSAINRLNISYTGEEWRLGAMGRGPQRLAFQYSLNAGSLVSGTWINAPGLDFLTPNLIGVGAHNGTLAANQTQLSGSIGFLNIPIGATFWVRWVDMGSLGGGPGDGFGVDNFTIGAIPETSTIAAGFGLTALLAYAFWRQQRSLRPFVNMA